MKKQFLFYIIGITFLFQSTAQGREVPRRGLFVTVIQDTPVLSSRKEITKLIDFAKKAHIKILFVQIYRSNKAWFPSKVADAKPYKTCLKNISADPLALIIKEAHKQGIEVHAWLNMLSLGTNKEAVFLKKYGTEILTRNLKPKKTIEDYKIDGQYFLEPGDLRIRGELLVMLEEVLHAYPGLDGILFDYIRYPDKNPAYGYTKMNIERFKKATSSRTIEEKNPIWQNWKRAQVTELLKKLAAKVKEIQPNIKVSATGCAPFIRAYYEAYQDWPSWLKTGLVDSVTVMTYPPDVPEFEKYILEAKNKTTDFHRVNLGVGAYKLIDAPQIFAEQFKLCEESDSSACVILHYGSLLQNPALSNFLIEDAEPQTTFIKRGEKYENNVY